MISADIAVLGCGWAGLAATLGILERAPGATVVCLDASEEPGGLLRSERLCDHTFDVGGSHIIFSRDRELLSEILSLLGGGVVEHERQAFILLGSTRVPYPLENGLYALPPQLRAEMLVGFVEALLERAADAREPESFGEWARMFFGRTMAESYLLPYNRKIWKVDPDEMAADWVHTPGRLPVPDWRDVVRSGAGVETRGYLEQARFYYPASGGIQKLFDAALELAKSRGAHLLWGHRVTSVRHSGGKWVVNGLVEARRILSTIPLPELALALEAPEHVLRAAGRLRYNRVAVVGFALGREAPREHWVYVPDESVVFHRYAWISNYSPANAPKGSSTLQVEVTLKPRDPVDEEKLLGEVVEGLERLGVASYDHVKLARVWVHEYGYPVYVKGHNEAREEVMAYLRELGVVSVGRWGSWHYWNMDRVYKEAKAAAASLLAR